MQYRQLQINDQQELLIKTERRKGWVLSNFGILCIQWSISWLFWGIYGYFDPPENFSPSAMLNPAIVIGQLSILFGLLSLIYGIRRVKYANELRDTGEKVEYGFKHRRGAWLMTLAGGFLTLWGMFFLVLAIYNLVIIPKTPTDIESGFMSLQCSFLGLLFGLPLLLPSSMLIVSGREVKLYPSK